VSVLEQLFERDVTEEAIFPCNTLAWWRDAVSAPAAQVDFKIRPWAGIGLSFRASQPALAVVAIQAVHLTGRREGLNRCVASTAEDLFLDAALVDVEPHDSAQAIVRHAKRVRVWPLPKPSHRLRNRQVGNLEVANGRSLVFQEAMWAFNIELDEDSPAYLKLGVACLHSTLEAIEAIGKRNEGVTVETPATVLPVGVTTATAEGGTLQDALEGWKRHRRRPQRTVEEFSRSVEMFVQLHGNMQVVAIKKKHALEYRKALQDLPRQRTGELLRATLPAQAAWGREHPEAPRLTAATVNKQLGAALHLGARQRLTAR
jgi:hypothetical protein